jgi:translation initiation factor 1
MPNSKLVYTTSGSNLCSSCGRALHKCKCESEARPIDTNIARTPQIQLEKKGRGGKEVTVISHLGLSGAQLLQLLQLIKKKLGTGGTLKNQSLEIQGNRVAEVRELLVSQGILKSVN